MNNKARNRPDPRAASIQVPDAILRSKGAAHPVSAVEAMTATDAAIWKD
jgi:hypothetical protein